MHSEICVNCNQIKKKKLLQIKPFISISRYLYDALTSLIKLQDFVLFLRRNRLNK